VNILIVHNFYKQAGGEDQCVAAEAELLASHGHRVVRYDVSNHAIDAMGRVNLAARTVWSRPAARELQDLIRTHRPAIVHFHNTFPLISPSAYYVAQRANVRVVQTLHNFRLGCANALFFRDGRVCEDCLGRAFPWPALLHSCYRDSRAATAAVVTMLTAHRALGTWSREVDTYISLSDFSRRKLIACGLPADKIVVKPNFVSPDPGPGSGGGGYAIFVGRLSAEKGVGTLLDAWRQLNGTLPLKIVGDGPLAPSVRAAIADTDAVEWLGSLPSEAVYRLIGEAMMLVVPSECYETFGRVIVEAFAKGTPVIASAHGSMAELVEEGVTGLQFKPGSADELASAVRRLISDPAGWARMRRAARQAYVAKFTAAANYSALMTIYEQCLAKRAAPGHAEEISAAPEPGVQHLGGHQ
jgi:glycosyltransferase involved in cell wall biosynthesis